MWAIPGRRKREKPGVDLACLGPDFFSLHRANGDAVHVGANAGRVLRHGPEQVAGAGFLSLVHVQDRVAVAKAIGDCLANGQHQKVQFRIMPPRNSGDELSVRWFELRCEPMPIAADKSRNGLVLAVTRDISDRRSLENELNRQREKSESANIAKSRFLANMSHELRTPLNAILGFSELLQSNAIREMAPERSNEYISLIHSSAVHLLGVVNGILDMSKIEAGKYEIVAEPFDFAETLRSSCAMLQDQADRKRIRLCVGEMVDLPELTADPRAIRQIAINLVSNAIKFTGEGGKVDVLARRSGRNIELTVDDSGIGISSKHLQRLGQPFYQADSRYDRKYEGSGLGLSVVFGLVELHAGKIRFTSEKGRGTRVTVEIPILPPNSRPLPATEALEMLRGDRNYGRHDQVAIPRAAKSA
jgi:two-component system, cell cycle sensor histidine kinase DivJ